MPEQPDKPGGEIDQSQDKVRPVADRQAVKNQGSVTPDDYPEKDGAGAGAPTPGIGE